MKTEMRFCDDIGLWAIDRPIPASCVHATDYCETSCYNLKLYRLYPTMEGKDVRNENSWQGCSAEDYPRELARKRKGGRKDRFRLMTRGEAFRDSSDIHRVAAICAAMPDVLIWAPTRAWRDPLLRAQLEGLRESAPNLCLLASLDPSNTEAEYADLVSGGWPTMYFGDGSGWQGPDGFECPKTFRGLKGHCAQCKAGCFAERTIGRRVDVILKQH